MGDYIEREFALDVVRRTSGDYAAAFAEIAHSPAADVRPVVRGRWIKTPSDIGTIDVERCSVCGCEMNERNQFWNAPFCPRCGAEMNQG